MENLLQTILGQLDDNSIQAISKQTHAAPTQAKSALESAIPILMNALAKNSSTPDGAASLQKAIERDHDGSILDNLGGFLNNPEAAYGAGILKHVLGNKRQNVEQYLSKDAGVDSASAAKILEMAAPIVMGFLGKQKSAGGGGGGIGDLLNAYAKQTGSQGSQSMINQLLDRDGDGSVLDDIAEMGMSFLKKRKR